MPAVKLTADFLERCPGELPRDVHGDLAREDTGTPFGAHRELRLRISPLAACRLSSPISPVWTSEG